MSKDKLKVRYETFIPDKGKEARVQLLLKTLSINSDFVFLRFRSLKLCHDHQYFAGNCRLVEIHITMDKVVLIIKLKIRKVSKFIYTKHLIQFYYSITH